MQILQTWTVAAMMMIDAYIQPLVMEILKHPVFLSLLTIVWLLWMFVSVCVGDGLLIYIGPFI
jgi:hypothetical protein